MAITIYLFTLFVFILVYIIYVLVGEGNRIRQIISEDVIGLGVIG